MIIWINNKGNEFDLILSIVQVCYLCFPFGSFFLKYYAYHMSKQQDSVDDITIKCYRNLLGIYQDASNESRIYKITFQVSWIY